MSSKKSQLSSLCSQLYESAHFLLYSGEDGSPIYASQFRKLNVQVFGLINELYPLKGYSGQEEAEVCLALLMGFSATIYNAEEQEEKIQTVLDRAYDVLAKLDGSLLKCRLLLYCYAKIQDKELLEEVKEIIITWGGKELSEDEKELMEMYNEMVAK